jgi:DNA invertase Pin-like site-specific DNA recombinase
VVVTKLDRLGRSTRELLDLIDRISKAGRAFATWASLWDTGVRKAACCVAMLAAYQFERELIRAHW